MKEKEKTALQQVYDLLDEGCIGQVLKDRSEFLELEKKQIIDSCNAGLSGMPRSAIQYFTDTYE